MKIESPASQPAPQRCLVVDDDEILREFMATLLEMTGHIEVTRFASATEALPVFAATPGRFDFILTDFEMPVMNGVEFCHRVLALAPGTKILLVTGSPDINEGTARAAGFCGLLRKPFPATALWRILEAAA
jgi:CheY-like chemotaxis protein